MLDISAIPLFAIPETEHGENRSAQADSALAAAYSAFGAVGAAGAGGGGANFAGHRRMVGGARLRGSRDTR